MNKNVLIVDDSLSMRQVVGFTLRTAGYEVIEAEDGMDALTKLHGADVVHLVITDLNMPKLDGVGLIKNIRSDDKFRFLPAIVLTTEFEAEKKNEGRNAGATAWIVKPFKPADLLQVVRKVLG